ncbi:GATA zinc finger domain-containing protein [Lachnellula willkommii]|uniref:GATA zinc finger domain-containing protein n=1 Tax=Lachnellula willkommii TaxID=215461 RepID=A0A559M2J4_9HELO|nr:GATA zinc finger domain-containing protein [Lachnellula willkommii]
MESLDGPGRKSGILSLINRESHDRVTTDRSYTSASTMAATAVVNPASMYSNGPPPPYSGWPAPSSHSASGLVSPPESRRTSDNRPEPPPMQSAQPQRQSLPSIHEALGPKPSGRYASPVSASLPPQHQIPYSQSQAISIPQSHPPDHAPYPTQIAPPQVRPRSPPQPVQPQANPFSRPEPASNGFPEPLRHPSLGLQAAPAPHNPYAGPRYEAPRFEQDPRVPERLANGYPHQPPPQQQGSYGYGPGPNHAPGPHSPVYNQSRYSRDGREIDEIYKGGREDERSRITPFKQGLKRNLEVWDFENHLSSIYVSSGALQAWSKHFHSIAQEQQPRDPNGVPDRMPTLETCNEMLHNQEKIRQDLEKLRDMISQQHEHVAMMDQRMRDHNGKGPGYYDDGISVYDDDMKSQGYGGPESKKRRGRAAPPGRCHSCNRAETPEWRRGPDGARTLCNACGLHYAKLTRKNTMKQSQSSNGSSLRPKSMDGISPRPL